MTNAHNESGTATAPPAFGVDLITFFDPRYWGLAEDASLTEFAERDPHLFWMRMFDALERSGVTQLELTFPPADMHTAEAAFGSAEAFLAELDRRDLGVTSSYFGDIEHSADLFNPSVQAEIVAEADRCAGFLAAVGGRYLVIGLPMRRNAANGSGYEAVVAESAAPVADLLNRVGAVTAKRGIRTLLHTESHSIFWSADDVDLMMGLTDADLIGLCLDTGHVVLSGSDPVAVAHRHGNRLALAHWKDASGAFVGTPPVDAEIFVKHREFFRSVGNGAVDWRGLSAELNDQGFQECILLELDAAPDPEAALIAARTYLEDTLRGTLPSFVPSHAALLPTALPPLTSQD